MRRERAAVRVASAWDIVKRANLSGIDRHPCHARLVAVEEDRPNRSGKARYILRDGKPVNEAVNARATATRKVRNAQADEAEALATKSEIERRAERIRRYQLKRAGLLGFGD